MFNIILANLITIIIFLIAYLIGEHISAYPIKPSAMFLVYYMILYTSILNGIEIDDIKKILKDKQLKGCDCYD